MPTEAILFFLGSGAIIAATGVIAWFWGYERGYADAGRRAWLHGPIRG